MTRGSLGAYRPSRILKADETARFRQGPVEASSNAVSTGRLAMQPPGHSGGCLQGYPPNRLCWHVAARAPGPSVRTFPAQPERQANTPMSLAV